MSTETCAHCGLAETPWALCATCQKHICAACAARTMRDPRLLCPHYVQPDSVDHPPHYTVAGPKYESIRVIDDWGLGFSLGNAVKYILRAKHKGHEKEDLQKAQWYLRHAIEIGERPRTPQQPRLTPSEVVKAWQLSEPLDEVLVLIRRGQPASLEDALKLLTGAIPE